MVPDAWRRLYHQQLPELEQQKHLLMQESTNPKAATDVNDLRSVLRDMERVTSASTHLADPNFDGGQKPAKLNALVLTEVCKYIAFATRGYKQYGDS